MTRDMLCMRVRRFGGVDAIVQEDLPPPVPEAGQVLVRVAAAGVGPWDAWIRAGRSVLPQPLPLTLGSDLSGIVERVGPGVTTFAPGDEVYGVTNPHFTGAYAQYAVAEAGMIARKPARLSHVEAAAVPVVASTAWQMVLDQGHAGAATRVLVHGAAGNVGAFATQLAKRAGAEVIGTVTTPDVDYAHGLGADQVVDVRTARFEEQVQPVDVVVDTVGGDALARSFDVLAPGGVLVSAVATPDQERAARLGVRATFLLVAVTTEGLTRIAELLDAGQLITRVGEVLPLAQARLAHEMLEGTSHARGKIVLDVET
jgi:NADPH:quinone reductase-like Zn-dependent oxidoreductase